MDELTPDALRARVHAAIGEPEITDHGFDIAAARARRPRWWALGLGTASAPVRAASMVALVTAVAAVVTVGTLLNLRVLPKPAGSASGPAGQTQPHLASPSPAATVPLGPAVDGFAPEDVTAVSADQWWVLGSDSVGCSGAAGCARIVHTLDAGQTFTSIPTPASAVTGLRFRDAEDGWAYSSTTVWSTHDGGAAWSAVTFPEMTVEDLEASGGYVYAVACTATGACSLERSPVAEDSWQALPIPAELVPSGYVAVVPNRFYVGGSLNVHGSNLWMAFMWMNGTSPVNLLMTSTDDGENFSETSFGTESLPITSLYVVNSDVLWATCSGGTQTSVWRSTDGGGTFVMVNAGVGNGTDSIAGSSASSAVDAGSILQFSVDGGQLFQPVAGQAGVDNGTRWRTVGFTNSEDGFAFSYPNSLPVPPNGLWRTDDAGAQWYEVEFP